MTETENQASAIELEDGVYTVEVVLSGGSGRASVSSPTELTVTGQEATALIEWSSPYYDYMVVDGETYLPVNTEGNSVFEIPVDCFDEPIEVIADTTAMSVPHEITYTLTFAEDSLKHPSGQGGVIVVSVVLAAAAVGLAVWIRAKRKKHVEEEI